MVGIYVIGLTNFILFERQETLRRGWELKVYSIVQWRALYQARESSSWLNAKLMDGLNDDPTFSSLGRGSTINFDTLRSDSK